jgi:PAS domain S-box-containing protein
VITNSQGRIIFFNQAAENLWGLKSQDIVNRSVESLFLNDSSDKKQLTNLPFRDNLGFPGNCELKGLRGDGTVIELQISVSATGKGADTQITFFAVDNTEKKKYKEDIVKGVSALKDQEDALRKNQGILDAINKSLGYIETGVVAVIFGIDDISFTGPCESTPVFPTVEPVTRV